MQKTISGSKYNEKETRLIAGTSDEFLSTEGYERFFLTVYKFDQKAIFEITKQESIQWLQLNKFYYEADEIVV